MIAAQRINQNAGAYEKRKQEEKEQREAFQ